MKHISLCVYLCMLLTGFESFSQKFVGEVQYLKMDKNQETTKLPIYKRVFADKAVNKTVTFKDFYIAIGNDYLECEGTVDKRGRYIDTLKTYYRNGNLKEWIFYESGMKQGRYEQFYEEGPLKKVGFYVDDQKEGTFTSYHENGLVSGTYVMKEDKFVKQMSAFLENGDPSKKVYHLDETRDSIVFFKNVGEIQFVRVDGFNNTYKEKFYYDSGAVSWIYYHDENDKLIRSEGFDEKGSSYKSPIEIDKKDFKSALDEHVKNTFAYPDFLRNANLSSRTYVNFTIYPDGTVEVLDATSDAHPGFEEEAKRIIRLFKYKPFTLRNESEKVTFSYPIVFRLN
ncbi:energy transducer TonB [Neptunitalea lumnitzerae]|nr:energy transducer TonB [Neptunitalea sp. Y10]